MDLYPAVMSRRLCAAIQIDHPIGDQFVCSRPLFSLKFNDVVIVLD